MKPTTIISLTFALVAKFASSLHANQAGIARRPFVGSLVGASAVVCGPSLVIAEMADAPKDWGLSGKGYADDGSRIIRHMRFCVSQEAGAPNIEQFNKNMKREMIDFSSVYTKSGPRINDLRSDISLLAQHYTNSGVGAPVKPELRARILSDLDRVADAITAAAEKEVDLAALRAAEAVEAGTAPEKKGLEAKMARKAAADKAAAVGTNAAIQQRLLDNNPAAFEGSGFTVKQ